MKLRDYLSLIVLTLSIIGSAQGQDTADADGELQYRVEVVLFTQPSVNPEDEEQPTARPQGLTRAMAWPLRDSGRPGLGYERLEPAAHRLSRAASRLDAQPGFEVHWHAAWVQPGLGRVQAQAVALPFELRADGINGWIRIYRERFLHAETQITVADDDGALLGRMTASRRMRSEEQHYLDHPRMGVLVRVDPWEAPSESTAD